MTILDAGRATLELTDPAHAEYIDEVEVGAGSQGTSGSPSRSTTPRPTRRLADAGATVVAEPTQTPWGSLNARLEAPAGLQLTLFEEPADGSRADHRLNDHPDRRAAVGRC